MTRFMWFFNLDSEQQLRLIASFDAGAYWKTFGFLIKTRNRSAVLRIDSIKEGGLS